MSGKPPKTPRPPQGAPVPRLALLRRQAGLTQKELAERAGVSKKTISRVEKGANARFSTINLLARSLGISRERLLQRSAQSRRRTPP